jgi:phosphoribosylformylglycinamidine synthase subunit PurS
VIVRVFVTPRKGILDPQGRAAEGALKSLGFTNINSVHIGQYIVLDIATVSASAAADEAKKMCEQLLVNSVIEDYRFEVDDG